MDIITKARELGEMIQNSEEAIKLEKTIAIYNLDPKSQSLINEYNSMQEKFNKLFRTMPKEEVKKAQKELNDFKEEVLSYPIIQECFKAQEDYNAMVHQITEIINFSMRKDAFVTSSKKGCSSGGCGGCGN